MEILQLWPNAARPLRWNPLQIGRNIDPETQWRAFADIFGSVARLGVKRQKQELLEALRKVYVGPGCWWMIRKCAATCSGGGCSR